MDNKTIKLIQRVAKNVASHYTFSFYDMEDIEQEAFIIAMENIEKFDPSISSLENFLYILLNSRLKNFIRQNYVRKDYVCVYCQGEDPNCEYCQRRLWSHATKKNILEPIDIDNVNVSHESRMCVQYDVLNDMATDELFSIINQKLDIGMRADYLRMLDGVSVSKSRRKQIEDRILEILEDYGYDK